MGDRRKPIPEEIQRRLTKFFVTNLPDRCSGTELAGVIREFGAIFDIYIAKKRDKRGRRFGFFSFFDVKDKDGLIKTLSKIRLGENRLVINVARFILEDGEFRKPLPEKLKARNTSKGHFNDAPQVRSVTNGNASYRDALTGERRKIVPMTKSLSLDDSVSVFDDLQGRALVLKLASFAVLRNIRKDLNDLEFTGGNIRFLGGLQLLVSFNSNEQASQAKNELLRLNHDYVSVDFWEGQVTTFERLAWVKVHGLPLHLLSNGNVDNVAKLFGKVAHNAQLECNDVDISYSYVGLLVNNGDPIHGVVSVRWRDKLFPVWVNEDAGVWVPEFLSSDDKSSGPSMASATDHSSHVPKKKIDDDGPAPVEDASVALVGFEKETNKDGFYSPFMGSGVPGTALMKDCLTPSISVDFLVDNPMDTVKADTAFCLPNKNKRKNFRRKLVLGHDLGRLKNKRKKDRRKLVLGHDLGRLVLGQDSGSYNSSNERPIKEPRLDVDDPFGLAPFILDSCVSHNKEATGPAISVLPDLHHDPPILNLNLAEAEYSEIGAEDAIHEGSTATHVVDADKANIETEIDETTKMGLRLGVQLQDFEMLVRETIEQEANEFSFL